MEDDKTIEENLEIIPDEETDLGGLNQKVKKFKDSLDKCERERKENLDGWQRAKADHINYRNDEGKRFEDMARFVTAGLVQEVLPVLDSFDLSLGHNMPSDLEKGILLIRAQFEDILKKRGLKEIKVEMGEKLNTEKHEAIGEVISEKPAGTIAEVVQRGYLLHNRVLRPARVRVAK